MHSLTTADAAMSFAKLIQSDHDKAIRQIRRLLTTNEIKKGKIVAVARVPKKKRSQNLKNVQVAIRGRMWEAILDSSGTPNMFSKQVKEFLAVQYIKEPKRLITVEWISSFLLDIDRKVPISFWAIL